MNLIIGNFESEVCPIAIFKLDGVPNPTKDRTVIGLSIQILFMHT